MPINNYLTILSKPTYIRGRMSRTSRPLKNRAEKGIEQSIQTWTLRFTYPSPFDLYLLILISSFRS